jgi:predicted amino acid-binding ACT domain protein
MLRDVSPQVPQYVIKTHGVHRTGILKDVAGILAEAGVSIAATQKVALGTEYAMVLHAFHPDGEGHAEAISDEVRRALGASSEVRVKPLDHARARRRSFSSRAREFRFGRRATSTFASARVAFRSRVRHRRASRPTWASAPSSGGSSSSARSGRASSWP